VFQTRVIIETGIASAVAQLRPLEHLSRLKELVEEEREARRRQDTRLAIKLSGEFHLRLAELLDNRTLSDFLHELISRTSLIVAVYQAPGRPGCRCDEHDTLVDLVMAGDAERAAAHMRDHLETIQAGLDFECLSRKRADLKDILAGLRRDARRQRV
jgi:DNA-binding GntR family transcriptional regulator